MDQVLEVSPELVIVKNEQCIVLRMKDGKDGKLVLTNSVRFLAPEMKSNYTINLLWIDILGRNWFERMGIVITVYTQIYS